MKKTKAVQKLVKKDITQERERVLYSFDAKTKTVTARFEKTKKAVVVSALQVKELIARLSDIKRFYSYCNADIKLLSKLQADAQAKKQQLIVNTQYDSRKKLHRLLQQVALTHLKQKAKTKKAIKAKAKK